MRRSSSAVRCVRPVQADGLRVDDAEARHVLPPDARAPAVRADEERPGRRGAVGKMHRHGGGRVALVDLVVRRVLAPVDAVLESAEEDPPQESAVDRVRLGPAEGAAGQQAAVDGVDRRLDHDGLGRLGLELGEQLGRGEVLHVGHRVREDLEPVALGAGVGRLVALEDGIADAMLREALSQVQTAQTSPDNENVASGCRTRGSRHGVDGFPRGLEGGQASASTGGL